MAAGRTGVKKYLTIIVHGDPRTVWHSGLPVTSHGTVCLNSEGPLHK